MRFKYQNPCKSAVQTVRPQVCSSNSETPGLQFKYWDPRSEVQISRSQVYSSWNVDLGSQYLSRRPWFSVFELQTWGLTVWTADLGSHCLNCRPGVSLFELQTCMGFDIWTSQLLCIEISPPCFLYKHLSAVLLSRPDFRACLAFVEILPDNAQIFVILPGLLWFSAHSERHWAVCQMACCWTCLDIVADCWLTVLPVTTIRLKENDLRQRRPGSCNFRYSAEYLLVIQSKCWLETHRDGNQLVSEWLIPHWSQPVLLCYSLPSSQIVSVIGSSNKSEIHHVLKSAFNTMLYQASGIIPRQSVDSEVKILSCQWDKTFILSYKNLKIVIHVFPEPCLRACLSWRWKHCPTAPPDYSVSYTHLTLPTNREV